MVLAIETLGVIIAICVAAKAVLTAVSKTKDLIKHKNENKKN